MGNRPGKRSCQVNLKVNQSELTINNMLHRIHWKWQSWLMGLTSFWRTRKEIFKNNSSKVFIPQRYFNEFNETYLRSSPKWKIVLKYNCYWGELEKDDRGVNILPLLSCSRQKKSTTKRAARRWIKNYTIRWNSTFN